LTVERMCELAGVSRVGYYRRLAKKAPEEEETEVRAAIQAIFLENKRRYGRRRITVELRNRGLAVNHKRVGRLMREDNLLALQRRAFVKTTDSEHDCEIYLNLAACVELKGINQVWVADLTYIRLRGEFLYLAVILDRFSRSVVGWSLGRSLTVELTLAALRHRNRTGEGQWIDASMGETVIGQMHEGQGQQVYAVLIPSGQPAVFCLHVRHPLRLIPVWLDR